MTLVLTDSQRLWMWLDEHGPATLEAIRDATGLCSIPQRLHHMELAGHVQHLGTRGGLWAALCPPARLTPGRAHLLDWLADWGEPATRRDYADDTGLTRKAATLRMERSLEAGLVESVGGVAYGRPGRRQHAYRLTDVGREELAYEHARLRSMRQRMAS